MRKMRKRIFLGIDTSCYMTSLACLIDEKFFQYKRPVKVKSGSCGLRQSEALFQHIKSLPVLFDELKKDVDLSEYEISCVSVSTRPRSVENSYMPVFLAGKSIASIISDISDSKFFETSHQDGHIMAAMYGVNKMSLLYEPFISVHLSGGTSEILLCEFKENKFLTRIVGGTKDLPAGQFIDRIGVLTGMEFPSGKYLDYIAVNYEGSSNLKSKICVEDGFFNFSGEETRIRRLFEEGKINKEDAAFGTMKYVAETVKKAVLNVRDEYGIESVIMAGGVSSSSFIRKVFSDVPGVYFAPPEFSGDNAAGVCLLGKVWGEYDGE